MPRLLQINSTCNAGSTGRIAEGIGQAALDSGWESFIAYGRSANQSRSQTIRIGNRAGIYSHVLQSRLFDTHGLGSVRATGRLIRTIETQLKPDVIHLHNIHGYYLNYRLLFEYLQSIPTPVVWTLHDCWAFTGHCAYFDRVGCDKWEHGCNRCPQLATYPHALGFRDCSRENYLLKKELFASLGDRLTLVPVSDWLAGLLKRSFFGNTQIRTIHNGIDTDAFRPLPGVEFRRKHRLEEKTVLLGVASPWTARKGLDDMLRLRTLLPQEEYAIVLVGLARKQIAELPAGIVGIERTQSVRELAEIYSAADVFVNTTYEDNYPTVNLEAIACGTPVVTYRTGGSPESVTPQTGAVVPQGDLEATVATIRRIAAAGKGFYADRCRAYAEEHFDQGTCFRKYIELYRSLKNE